MTRFFEKIAVAAGILWLASGAHCVLPHVNPHVMIDYILDAKFLWHTVTNMKMFPGPAHALNDDLGISLRWKDFLRDHGNRALDDAISELKWNSPEIDSRSRNVERRFRKILMRTNRGAVVLPVVSSKEQFVARYMVNSFAGHWWQRYAAEWEAQHGALLHEAAGARQESGGSIGLGQITDSERTLSGPAQVSTATSRHEESSVESRIQ